LVGESGVARAENQVRLDLDADLLGECLLHVDLSDDAEAIGGQRFLDLGNHLVERPDHVDAQCVAHDVPPAMTLPLLSSRDVAHPA